MPRQLQPCGSRAAYVRHLNHREAACQACLDANAHASRDWRRQFAAWLATRKGGRR